MIQHELRAWVRGGTGIGLQATLVMKEMKRSTKMMEEGVESGQARCAMKDALRYKDACMSDRSSGASKPEY